MSTVTWTGSTLTDVQKFSHGTTLSAFLPQVGIVTVDGDCLRYVEGVFKDKFHVLGRAQAGIEQVLGGDGLTQHVGNELCLVVFFTGADLKDLSGQLGFLRPILVEKDNVEG